MSVKCPHCHHSFSDDEQTLMLYDLADEVQDVADDGWGSRVREAAELLDPRLTTKD